jgi:hypothetical protein
MMQQLSDGCCALHLMMEMESREGVVVMSEPAKGEPYLLSGMPLEESTFATTTSEGAA